MGELPTPPPFKGGSVHAVSVLSSYRKTKWMGASLSLALRHAPRVLRDLDQQPVKRFHRCRARVAFPCTVARCTLPANLSEHCVFQRVRRNAVNPACAIVMSHRYVQSHVSIQGQRWLTDSYTEVNDSSL